MAMVAPYEKISSRNELGLVGYVRYVGFVPFFSIPSPVSRRLD